MSQFGEDLWLLDYFGTQRDGFFVDVGAFHPYHLSNTHLLTRRGWRGINLEPVPTALAEFERHRRGDINLPYAVSTKRGPVTFAAAGSFAGIDDETHLWRGIQGERLVVEARPLSEILDEHLPAGRTIDLLDVDCEGHDLEVLRSNDWDRFRPRVVLAEHHEGAGESPQSFLEANGYTLRARLSLTLVFVDEAPATGATVSAQQVDAVPVDAHRGEEGHGPGSR
jgi:FkbM family methyltransferase